MASKGGPRAVGTDGRDFSHREQVANHYKTSAVNKWRFKFAAMLHLMMGLLMAFRLSVSFFVMFGMRPPSSLQRLRLPRAEAWEYVWLCSVLSSVFGMLALRRNKSFLMQQYLIGTVVFGLAPVVYAVYSLYDDLLLYIDTRESKKLFLGFPLVVLWNMFLVIALQVHAFGLIFACNLLKAWTASAKKRA